MSTRSSGLAALRIGTYTSPMLSAALFLLLAAPPASAGRAVAGDSAEVFWSGDRVALMKARSVEFYRLPAGAKAYIGASSDTAKALESAALPHGRVFFRRGGAEFSLRPAAARSFQTDLLPPGHSSGRRGAVLVCAKDPGEFCGAMDLRGREIFRMGQRPPGSELEPIGLSEDGSSALFGVVSTQPRRETRGYFLRVKSGPLRTAALDDPEARRLLGLFQGDAVLAEP